MAQGESRLDKIKCAHNRAHCSLVHCTPQRPNFLSKLGGKEPLIIAQIFSKSCFVEWKPITGSGTNSCFHHDLKGRKPLNKDIQTTLKEAPWVKTVILTW